MRQAVFGAAVLAAWVSAGCVKGRGEACVEHSQCEAGLACVAGACDLCGDGQSCVGVDLRVRSCDSALNPLEGVTALKITLYGQAADGSETVLATETKSVGDKGLVVPAIPFGKGRRLVVEGLESVDAVRARSRGATAPFDVSEDAAVPAQVVYLRPVERFGPADARGCSGLNVARAGHTATRLKDGKVLVVGGYAFDEQHSQRFLDSVELYDPKTGEFLLLGATLRIARAGHTATLLPDGRVLIAGGEALISGRSSGLQLAEIFDPASQSFTSTQMKKRRMRHSAAMLPSGVVLLAGGVEEPGLAPMINTEVFLPNERGEVAFQEGPTMLTGRADHASIGIEGDRIVVIGGVTSQDKGLNTAEVFSYLGGLFVRTNDSWSLATERSNPYAVELDAGGSDGVLVLGVPSGNLTESQAFDYFAVGSGGTTPDRAIDVLPTSRKHACAAAFNGGAIVVGGRNPQSGALLETADAYELEFTPPATTKLVARRTGSISTKRTRMACTSLADGTVLVTGGESADGGAIVSTEAQVYQPKN